MSDEKNENPIVKIATYSAGSSAGIAFLAFFFLHSITDVGMFAVAIAVAAPSVMAYGICHAMIKYGRTTINPPETGNKP